MDSRPVGCISAVAHRLRAMQSMLVGLRTVLYLLQIGFEKVFETSTGNLVWVKIHIIHAETSWRSSSFRD